MSDHSMERAERPELEPERATPQSTAICEDKDGRASVLMAPKRAAFVHRWDAAIVLDSDRGSNLSKRVMYNLPR